MSTIEQLSQRIEEVVAEYLEGQRFEAEVAVRRAFGLRVMAAKRSAKRQSTKAENRREARVLALLRERALRAVLAKPGETMRVIAAEANSSARDLQFPMRQLRETGLVRSAGQGVTTRYYPMAVAASVGGEE
jgi:predicted transcriptional regulator